MIFGCKRFRDHKHLVAQTSANLFNYGILPSTIGSFTKITNPAKVNPLKNCQNYIYKVHRYIVFGDCVDLGGNKYALLLVDVSER